MDKPKIKVQDKDETAALKNLMLNVLRKKAKSMGYDKEIRMIENVVNNAEKIPVEGLGEKAIPIAINQVAAHLGVEKYLNSSGNIYMQRDANGQVSAMVLPEAGELVPPVVPNSAADTIPPIPISPDFKEDLEGLRNYVYESRILVTSSASARDTGAIYDELKKISMGMMVERLKEEGFRVFDNVTWEGQRKMDSEQFRNNGGSACRNNQLLDSMVLSGKPEFTVEIRDITLTQQKEVIMNEQKLKVAISSINVAMVENITAESWSEKTYTFKNLESNSVLMDQEDYRNGRFSNAARNLISNLYSENFGKTTRDILNECSKRDGNCLAFKLTMIGHANDDIADKFVDFLENDRRRICRMDAANFRFSDRYCQGVFDTKAYKIRDLRRLLSEAGQGAGFTKEGMKQYQVGRNVYIVVCNQ